jgi:hypothetical protein
MLKGDQFLKWRGIEYPPKLLLDLRMIFEFLPV